MRMEIIRKDKMCYVRYMARFNTDININYISNYNLPKQEISIKKDRYNFGRFTVFFD